MSEPTNKPPVTKESWMKEKIGKPLFWVGIGFVTCKLLDAYTENKRVKRIKL